jgi:hypothetical protein
MQFCDKIAYEENVPLHTGITVDRSNQDKDIVTCLQFYVLPLDYLTGMNCNSSQFDVESSRSVQFTLEQPMEAQRDSRGIVLLFL